MPITLDDLQIRARNRANMTNSEFIDDSELTTIINDSLAELYDLLVQEYGLDNFLDGYEFNTASGKTRYDMPTNFYKFAGLDLQHSSKYYGLTRFAHADRLLYENATSFIVDGLPRYRYRLRKMHLEILPAPESTHKCVLHFIPQITRLSATSDTVDDAIVESWMEYVEVDAAIKMLIKEESDVQELMAIKAGLINRIRSSAQGRDMDIPEVSADSGNTLFNLRIQARYKSNMLGKGTTLSSDLVSDRELSYYINQELGELHDILTKAYDAHFFVDSYQFSTESGKRDYNLPTDFYKLGGVDISVSGETYTLENYNFQERSAFESSTIYSLAGAPYFRYHIQRNSIRLLPTPNAAYTVVLWYSKALNRLKNDEDVVDNVIITEWLDYVTTGAAIRSLNKVLIGAPAEQTASIQAAIQILMVNKAELAVRLEQITHDRDWGNPQKVTDLDVKNSKLFWW
jgi:hypothetical protein